MNSQIKFSDILRYVLLGAFLLGYFIFFGYILEIDFLVSLTHKTLNFVRHGDGVILVLVLFLIISMFLGMMVQSLRGIIEFYPKRWLQHYVLNRTKEKNKIILELIHSIFSFLLYGSVFYECIREKSHYKHHDEMPDWIYLMNDPNKALNYVRGHISKDIQEETSSLAESYYYQELFMGMSYVIFIIPLLICFLWNDLKWTFFNTLIFCFFIGILIMKFTASRHSRTYLQYIDSLYNIYEDSSSSLKSYIRSRLPMAYVLIRTIDQPNRLENITRAVESVLNQNYPRIHIIILEDLPLQEQTKIEVGIPSGNLISDIERTLYQKNGPKPENIQSLKTITTYRKSSKHLGASGSSLEIKEMFLSEATKNDIAISLDDDDYFGRQGAIKDIVTKITATNADICLTTFRNVSDMGYVLSNGGGKFHNEIVKELYQLGKSVNYHMNLIFVDTLGWTKSYNYHILKKYVNYIKNYNKIAIKNKDKSFTEIHSFEDFPDFVCFLFKKSRICAIDNPTHCYYNRAESITGSRNNSAFFDRRDFLAYTLGLANYLIKYEYTKQKDQEKGISRTKDFIIYKIGVISNIINTKFPGYSTSEFISLCVNEAISSGNKNSHNYLLAKIFLNSKQLIDTLTKFIKEDKSLIIGEGNDESDETEFLRLINIELTK